MNTLPAKSRKLHAGHVRDATVSGIFYPSSRQELSNEISALMESSAAVPIDCGAIISPHGSLSYSGPVAAAAWKTASSRDIETIVLISPSHRSFEPGIFLPESIAFSIPTGEFTVDRRAVKELMHCSTYVQLNDIPHLEEHAIEMQLPFIAYCYPNAKLLPIIVSRVEDTAIDTILANLRSIFYASLTSTLFVFTSNMAVSDTAAACLSASKSFAECLTTNDPAKLQAFATSLPSFCGGKLIASYLRSELSAGTRPILLKLLTSEHIAEKGEPLVGYAAIAFAR
jgi:MEMO1 family protein